MFYSRACAKGFDLVHNQLMTNKPPSQLKVGILVQLFGATYFGQMVDGASTYLKSKGVTCIVKSGTFTAESELEAIKALLNENCDGLIIQSDWMSDDMLEEIYKLQSNIILMNRYFVKQKYKCVFVDNYSAAKNAATYLVKRGHQRIAMVTGFPTHKDVIERTKGFADQLDFYGQTLLPSLTIESDFTEKGGHEAMKALLNANVDLTAVWFQNDTMAVGAILYCQSVSVRIPEDISIMGFDDQDMARQVSPTLTTIKQPMHEIGMKSGELLYEKLTEAKQRKPVEIKLDIIERDSVAALYKPESKMAEKVRLSTREIECLNWASKGKTAYESAVIIGISESTVVFHLRNASVKLNTVNRTHSVAKAILDSHLH